MIVVDISIIINKKLVKKWFISEKVTAPLRELMDEYYTIGAYNGEFNIASIGVDIFFDKIKALCSLEEISLRDLVNNYTSKDIEDYHSFIFDVDKTDYSTDEQILEIIESYEEGKINQVTALVELKKLGWDIPLLPKDYFTIKTSCTKVYAIDCSMDLDSEYHSYFMLFDSKEKALLFKKIFTNGTIGDSIFRFSNFNYFVSLLYGEKTCCVKELPEYRGRISFLLNPIYFGEDEY